MMEPAPPESLSVYRGQSRRGIGEGPDNPIAQGEQYLAAHPSLAKNGEMLTAIRPWMSLDSDPADHQRLGDRLEGWSCFHYRDLQFVVRLVSAGTYDRRAAYFAHGRAWSTTSVTPGFDPGLYLGRSEAFEAPWRDADAGERVVEPYPSLVRPEAIADEPATAALLLGHLFQALEHGYPLVIAVPVADFLAGSPLHALVSFSRAALPTDRKSGCRIRIYTRLPDLFLKHLQANLVVVPEEVAGDALMARRDATLLDRQGQWKVGKRLDPTALAYAEAVVERAIRLPEGLPLFTERFRDRRTGKGLPSQEDTRAVQITFNLAYALRGSNEREQLGDLLRNYLPKAAQKLGPGLDWKRLIDSKEWESFPREALLDVLLLDSAALQPGARELQEAVEDALVRIGLVADPGLTGWWNPAEPWKLRRLLELLAHSPPLISRPAAVERTSHLPIREIAAVGPADGVLEIELKQGTLARRAPESDDLARLAHEPKIFDILSRAVMAGKLDTQWARVYVSSAQGAEMPEVAKRLFSVSDSWDKWGDVPKLFLDRLRSDDSDVVGLGPLIVSAGLKIDPLRHLDTYLRLTDLLARIDEQSGDLSGNLLLLRLLKALPDISNRSDRELLVSAALGKDWKCLRPKYLLQGRGLRVPWLAEMADSLVASDELVESLEAPALLELGTKLQDEKSYERLYVLLDKRMQEEQEETTLALIRSRWWYFWRRRSRLKQDELCEAAKAWLTSDAWLEKGPEATYEAWELAVADLPQELPGLEMRALCNSGRHHVPGPSISPFEEDQLSVLEYRSSDLGALAELTEAIRSDQRFQWIPGPHAHEYVLKGSLFSELNPGSFAWLMEHRSSIQLSVPSLKESAFLCEHSGHRKEKALEARSRSVTEWLDRDPQKALAEAGNPYLWSRPYFLALLAEWMCYKGSVAEIGRENVRQINQYANGEPSHYPQAPSLKPIMRELVDQGYERAARLLASSLYTEIQEESLTETVVRALYNGRDSDPCWLTLASEIHQAQLLGAQSYARPHALSSIARRIREGVGLSKEQKRSLAEKGWPTFERAACAHPELLRFVPQEQSVLPAFELAASLLGPGAVGNAASLVISAAGNRGNRSTIEWWRALLRGVLGCLRRGERKSPDDRDDTAIELIRSLVAGFEENDRAAFSGAVSSVGM